MHYTEGRRWCVLLLSLVGQIYPHRDHVGAIRGRDVVQGELVLGEEGKVLARHLHVLCGQLVLVDGSVKNNTPSLLQSIVL